MSATTFTATANVTKIAQVLQEIERRKAARRDYIYPASKLRVADDGGLVFAASNTFRVGDRIYTEWADAEAAADAGGQTIVPLGQAGALPLSRTAEGQLAERLGVPLRYIDALRGGGHADLAAHNFSTLLGRSPARFLVRTLDGRVRAVLSDRYRVLDNCDVFFAAAEAMQAAGADVWNARLWDNGFEMLAVSKDVTGAVLRDPGFNGPNHGWAHLPGGEGGEGGGPDLHNAAVKISNSETGCGGLSVQFAVLRQVCNNTAVVGKGLSVIHIGGRARDEGALQYAEDTLESESKTVWLKLRDAVKTAFDRPRFEEYIGRLNGLAARPIEEPEKAVANVVQEFQLPEERRKAILKNLFAGRDLSAFGLVQAVTAAAHEAPDEEASRLEAVGGQLIEAPASRWKELGVGV